jgi:two-component system, OmpR family, response regulator
VFCAPWSSLKPLEIVAMPFGDSSQGWTAQSPHQAILVVDDDVDIRRLLHLAFAGHGVTVLSAPSGQEAVEVYRQRSKEIALVLLDVQMPHQDGPQTLRLLRQINPDVVAVFISGHTGRYSQEDLLALGAAKVVAKPFLRLDAFVDSVLHLLSEVPQHIHS